MINVFINVAYLCVSLYIEYAMNYNKWMNEKNHLKPGNVQFSTSYWEKLLKSSMSRAWRPLNI